MLARDADGLTYGDIEDDPERETQRVYRAEDPAVLERVIDEAGIALELGGYKLGGIHMAGAGKGLQVAVSVLWTTGNVILGRWWNGTSGGNGLKIFFWKGETPEAIEASFAEASARMEAWAPPGSWTRTIRAWEFGGASDGMQFMGCMVVDRQTIIV
jgi:hypothetical protein